MQGNGEVGDEGDKRLGREGGMEGEWELRRQEQGVGEGKERGRELGESGEEGGGEVGAQRTGAAFWGHDAFKGKCPRYLQRPQDVPPWSPLTRTQDRLALAYHFGGGC